MTATQDTGTYGAKVQSWKRANPRDLLKRIIDANPGAGKEALLRELRDELRCEDAEEFLDSIIEYWFANNYASLMDREHVTVEARAAAIERKRDAVEKVKTTILARILDMRMPNGLALSECTFGYLTELGGGLARIGAAGEPGDVVGLRLCEEDVRALYMGTK